MIIVVNTTSYPRYCLKTDYYTIISVKVQGLILAMYIYM